MSLNASKFNFSTSQLDTILQTSITCSSTTPTALTFCTKHSRSVLKILTGSFISHLFLNQLPGGQALGIVSTSFILPPRCYPYVRNLSILVWSMHVMYGRALHKCSSFVTEYVARVPGFLHDSPLPLKFRRNIASSFIFYRYFHVNCSFHFAYLYSRGLTAQDYAHLYDVQIPYA